jgi:hypothetical protein
MERIEFPKIAFILTLFLIIVTHANAFVITTTVEQAYADSVKLTEENSLHIDASALASSYPWHEGVYVFVPYYYKPIVEGESHADRPAISFKVRFLDKSGNSHALDCKAGWGYASFHSEGETQRCDGGSDRMQGRIEYRINRITGPVYVKTEQTETEGGAIPVTTATLSLKPGQSTQVVIDFSVRFRTDGGTGAGGTFTDWISSQGELLALAATQPPQPGAPAGPQDIIPNYYIYFSDEDIDTLATYYVPYWSGQDLGALGYAEREALVYQTLPQFFSLSEQGTGSTIQCVPSETFSGMVVDGKTLGYVLMCSDVKKNARYTARFVLPVQNQLMPIDFCWYIDSGGNLNAC